MKEDKLQIQNQLGNFYGNQKKEQQDREIAMVIFFIKIKQIL